jgi:GrpB-like predicted nucleotidyltransferase (UPF0157 family)
MPADNDLHDMTLEKLGQLFPVIISEPSDKWASYYQTESQMILDKFSKSEIERIDHIGSTAIPGLRAKPVIDILLQVSGHTDLQRIIDIFQSLDYYYTEQPDNPAPHMMFVKGYSINGYKGQAYHVHVRYKGDWDELYFRDYLITHRIAAKGYEKLKLDLSGKFKNDREAYTKAKTAFISKVNKLARR